MSVRKFLLIVLAFIVPAAQAAQTIELVSYSANNNAAVTKITDEKGSISFAYCMLPLDDKNSTLADAMNYLEKNARACYRRTGDFKSSNEQDTNRFAELLKANFSETISQSLKVPYAESLRMTEMLLPMMLMPLVGPIFMAPVMDKALNGKSRPWTPKFKKFYIAAAVVTALAVAFAAGSEIYIYRTKTLREASIETLIAKSKTTEFTDLNLSVLTDDSGFVLSKLYAALEKTVRDYNQAGARP